MYDLNDAQPQMAPHGDSSPTAFLAGEADHSPRRYQRLDPMDAGLLKSSHTSDAQMLDCEITVVAGPYARRKFWQNFTVAGGKRDEKGQSKGWKSRRRHSAPWSTAPRPRSEG